MNIPTEWTFETDEVADAFNEHVREQLPWYDLVTDAVAQIARHYVARGTIVFDLGAGNGNVGRAIAETLRSRDADLLAIEESRAMCETYTGPGVVVEGSIAGYDYEPFSVAVSMLTLMFLSPQEQERTLARLVRFLRPGGAVILVERMLPPDGYLSVVTSRITLAAKAKAGVPADQIMHKELALAGVQRPVDPALMRVYGAVEWFRFGDFAGYVIESKEEA